LEAVFCLQPPLLATGDFMLFSDVAHRRVGLKVSAVFLFSASLLWLAGCDVTSINALYDGEKDPDLVLEPALIGSWSYVDQKCTTVLTITAKDRAYDFRSVEHGQGCDNAGKESRQLAHLVKVDSHYFLDVEPTDEQVCDSCLATHWIALATFDSHKLALTPIDSDGLGELIHAGIVDLSTLPSNSDDDISKPSTLTARTSDLKNFCRQFATDLTVFRPDSAATFERN
jgi:hypothetical protein